MRTKTCVAATLVTTFLAACGCGGGHSTQKSPRSPTRPAAATTLGVASVELPGNSYPSGLAFASDGTLWVTESSRGAVARLTPDGALAHFQIPGESTSPDHIIQGPGGTMWFTGFQVLGRVDSQGQLTGWETHAQDLGRPGFPSSLTLGPDGAVWYTNETTPPRISRITETGELTGFPLGNSAATGFNDITLGGDRALWFIEDEPAGIGRMTVDGDYRHWPLPRDSVAFDITAGPGDAVWFTLSTHLARISPTGRITRFPLPRGVEARGITPGRGDALWFTTDTSLGRITSAGAISLWPVPNAELLGAITVAPDGTLWTVDQEADRLWHLTPPT